ncbi:hypothetical protein ACF09H_29750 [Streptomyces sp. NPDC014983]|uniref:hypothetical protein n=1 Tax=Streptomyces sp. NPDC014983 TaxID=3364933 RepID=UPI0037025FB5
MGQLPRYIPESALQELRGTLEDAGITLGPLAPGRRVTHTAEHRGATWELTFMGYSYGWAVRGPGVEQGVSAFAEDVPEIMNRPAGPQLPDGPLEWAVRHRDGRVWKCTDQADAEGTAAVSRTMTAVYRTPGGEWTTWRPETVTPSTGRVPRTYAGIPVPAAIREVWDAELGQGWRLGVRSALAR